MSKSVLQQLIEQTCNQAKSQPSNKKPQQPPVGGNSNGHSSPSKSDGPSTDTLRQQPARTAAAAVAPRCQHVKTNGVRCKSPAMRTLNFCFYHEKIYNPPYEESFPALEDANSVQLALLQVLNGLKYRSITLTEARVMIYALKAASINVRRTNFEPIMTPQVTEFPSWYRQADMPKPEDYPTLREQTGAPSASASASHLPSVEAQGFNPEKEEPLAERTARSASPSASVRKPPAPQVVRSGNGHAVSTSN